MKKVLVTGCAGFIGSHFCRLLLAKGHRVIGVDNFDPFYSRTVKESNISDLTGHENFVFYEADILDGLTMITDTDIDLVVHLAAKAGVRPSIADPEAYINVNIKGTQKVHDFMAERSVKHLVFASSSSVYGNNAKVPFHEADPVDHPISPYAFTKKACELMNFTFHHLQASNVVNLRFFTVYGAGQRPDLAIHKFMKQIMRNEPITLYGNGETQRDYTYIDDIVQGIYNASLYCLGGTGIYEIFNLGNSNPVKLKDLVEMIYHFAGAEKNIVYGNAQPGDVEITYADISKAGTLLNYHPQTTIEQGLKKFIHSFQKEKTAS